YLDIDFRFGCVIDIRKNTGSGDSHADEDGERNNGPENLNLDVLVESGRDSAPRLAVINYRPEHHCEDDHPNGNARPEDHHVKAVGFPTDFGYTPGHIEVPGCLQVCAEQCASSSCRG